MTQQEQHIASNMTVGILTEKIVSDIINILKLNINSNAIIVTEGHSSESDTLGIDPEKAFTISLTING